MKIHQNLESVYGTSCSYHIACWLIGRFQSGKSDFRDGSRSGALKTVVNENTVTVLPFTWYNSPN